jgi:hypothetical protein
MKVPRLELCGYKVARFASAHHQVRPANSAVKAKFLVANHDEENGTKKSEANLIAMMPSKIPITDGDGRLEKIQPCDSR